MQQLYLTQVKQKELRTRCEGLLVRIVYPQSSYVEVLTLSTSESDFIWK